MFTAAVVGSNLKSRTLLLGGFIRQQSGVVLAILDASPQNPGATRSFTVGSSSLSSSPVQRVSRNSLVQVSPTWDSFSGSLKSLSGSRSFTTSDGGANLAENKDHDEEVPLSGKKPTLEEACAMPLTVHGMDNATLVTLGRLGDHQAHKEILKRHIMTVDNVGYDEACKTFKKIQEKNGEGRYLLTLPYRVGIAAALTAGFLSFPLVFHMNTAEWFNEYFVTTDIPEAEDLETWLEVGAWTWNWMEPPLGQISFFLLCLQFSRAQMENLGLKPYTKKIKRWRGEHLASLFPQYDEQVIINYSESSRMIG